MTACAQHPTKVADQPCARCGTFVCEWCMKLAPDWAAGLCVDCQQYVQVAPPPGREGRLSGFAFLISMGWTALGLAESVAWGAERLPAPEAVVTLVLSGALMAGAAASALLVALRRREAPGVAKAVLGVFVLLELAGFALDPERSEHARGVFINVGVGLAWVAWFTLSPEVPRLFVNGRRR